MQAPQICATVTGRTVEDIRRAAAAAAGADVVEVRLDTLEAPDSAAVLDGRTRPTVATCRPAWEGGRFTGSEEDRRRVLFAAAAAGAEFVDVEAAAPFADELIRLRRGRGVVLSAHLFGSPPADLGSRYAALRARGAEVVKLAITAERAAETLPLFDIAASCPENPGHVLLAMGNAGVATRILAARLRNRWTYAGDAVAPGQLPVERLVREYGVRRIRRDADLYAIAGRPVLHSLSPVMHNAGFAALGVNAAYVPIEAGSAEDFVRVARALDLKGASITAPYKIPLAAAMDELHPIASQVGAVNTLVVRDGRWIGFNTDVEGVALPLRRRLPLQNARATVLGAGGAARAVAVALSREGARVTVSARRPDAAASLAASVDGTAVEFPPPPGTWDVLVNTIPSGTGLRNPMAGVQLDGRVVFDLAYVPARTPLLAAAEDAGCVTIGGLEMLIVQAEAQFELWTGRRPPADLFRTSVRQGDAQPAAPGTPTSV